MSFTAEFVGGPLDGVRSLVQNPPLPPGALWGWRCPGRRCALADLLPADLKARARAECREQRCHCFVADPTGDGLPGAMRYRRAGARRNVHRYELDEGAVPPGGAIFADARREEPVTA